MRMETLLFNYCSNVMSFPCDKHLKICSVDYTCKPFVILNICSAINIYSRLLFTLSSTICVLICIAKQCLTCNKTCRMISIFCVNFNISVCLTCLFRIDWLFSSRLHCSFVVGKQFKSHVQLCVPFTYGDHGYIYLFIFTVLFIRGSTYQ